MSAQKKMGAVNKSVPIFLVLLNAHATMDCKSIPQTMRNVLVSRKLVFIFMFCNILLIQENVFYSMLLLFFMLLFLFWFYNSPSFTNNLFSN